MGTVWLGRDQKLGRQVAVKVMAQELAQMSEALQRFEREALAVAQLHSTHIVQVYDYGVQEGLPYIVMELLEGENLGQRLKKIGHIRLDDAARILQQICKGLKAAHGASLIHRDLKPSNIFLARRDDTEVVKLLDFGVVKAIDPLGVTGEGQAESTVTGLLLGTPQYMSPEQARATRDIDHRSDLWSVAVIAFRMLTGKNPFKGESVGDVVLKICSDALPKITEHRAGLPASLDAFFEKAFARDPNDRYQSADEMAACFAQFVEGEVASVPQGAVDPLAISGSRSGATPGAIPAATPSDPSAATPASMSGGLGPAGPMSGPLALSGSGQHAAVSASGPFDPRAAQLAEGGFGASAGSAAFDGPVLEGPMAEPTPISTTVGGTQLSPHVVPRKPRMTAPLAAVVGVGVALLVGGLGAAIYVDSTPAQVAPATGHAPTPDGDLLSSDDDGGGDAAEPLRGDEGTSEDVIGSSPEGGKLDEVAPTEGDGGGEPKQPPRPSGRPSKGKSGNPFAVPKPSPTPPAPAPKPKPKWF